MLLAFCEVGKEEERSRFRQRSLGPGTRVPYITYDTTPPLDRFSKLDYTPQQEECQSRERHLSLEISRGELHIRNVAVSYCNCTRCGITELRKWVGGVVSCVVCGRWWIERAFWNTTHLQALSLYNPPPSLPPHTKLRPKLPRSFPNSHAPDAPALPRPHAPTPTLTQRCRCVCRRCLCRF